MCTSHNVSLLLLGGPAVQEKESTTEAQEKDSTSEAESTTIKARKFNNTESMIINNQSTMISPEEEWPNESGRLGVFYLILIHLFEITFFPKNGLWHTKLNQ
jgi:hypothetical protein